LNPVEASEILSSIRLIAVLRGSTEKVIEEIREKLAKHGVQMFLRAEGYAIARDEAVAKAGLPHLRLAVSQNAVSMWVRSPESLQKMLLDRMGYTVDSLLEEILGSATIIEETIRSSNPEFLESNVPKQ